MNRDPTRFFRLFNGSLMNQVVSHPAIEAEDVERLPLLLHTNKLYAQLQGEAGHPRSPNDRTGGQPPLRQSQRQNGEKNQSRKLEWCDEQTRNRVQPPIQ